MLDGPPIGKPGSLPIRVAFAAVTAGGISGFALAAAMGRSALLSLVIYVAASTAYSFGLKRIPMLDVLVLAVLFSLRLVFGIALADVPASPWLLVFSMFVFMSLSLAKRYTEVTRNSLQGADELYGRGYVSQDAQVILALGIATAAGAVLIMILYLIEEAFAAAFYTSPASLWLLPIILFLWLGRIWLLAGRHQLDDDPIRFAIGDGASLALGCAMVVVFVIAWRL